EPIGFVGVSLARSVGLSDAELWLFRAWASPRQLDNFKFVATLNRRGPNCAEGCWFFAPPWSSWRGMVDIHGEAIGGRDRGNGAKAAPNKKRRRHMASSLGTNLRPKE